MKAIFGTNIPTFFTGREVMGGFGANGVNNSWEITGKELLDMAMGGTGGQSGDWQEKGLGGAIKKNLEHNGARALATAVVTPLVFRFGRRLLSKPLINPANRALKSMGVKEVKL